MNIMYRSIFALSAMVLAVSVSAADLSVKDFSQNVPLVTGPTVVIQPVFGAKVLPEAPSELSAGYLYLRRKIDGNTYAWYKGKPTSDAFQKLKLFSGLGGKPNEFIFTRFYGTKIAKPFQDETDVYFDSHGVYSIRVPKMFFVQADQWIEITGQVSGVGIISVESNIPAIVYLNGDSVGVTPKEIPGVVAGIHSVVLRSDSTVPFVYGVQVSDGATVKQVATLEMLPKQMIDSVLPGLVIDTTVSLQNEALKSQKLKAQLDSLENIQKLNLAKLDSLFPKILPRPATLKSQDARYESYLKSYNAVKAEALLMFTKSEKDLIAKLALGHASSLKLLDSLKNMPITQKVQLVSVSLTEQKQVQFLLRSNDKMIDVGWVGAWDSTYAKQDSIMQLFADSAQYLEVDYFPHTVSFKYDSLVSEKYYRYKGLTYVNPNGRILLAGKFVLPLYILDKPEVQAWLYPKTAPSKVVADTSKKAAVWDSTEAKPADDSEKIIWMWRGDVAEIPGGTFRYASKLVTMSPFAIHKKEVTQEHYQRLMMGNPATRKKGAGVGPFMPVHSVNWEDAQEFCEMIGGSLPTEAQWEYAARAGANDVELWKTEAGTLPATDYAVFDRKAGPQEVGTKKANAFGLFDVHGNVSEWTKDSHSWFSFYVESKDPSGALWGTDRIFKGGSFESKADEMNLKDSDYEDPRFWSTSLGFRCAFPALQPLQINEIRQKLKDLDAKK